jgi:hypothetical protein
MIDLHGGGEEERKRDANELDRNKHIVFLRYSGSGYKP